MLPWMGSVTRPLRELLRVTRHGAHLILTVANRWRLNHVLDPLCFQLLQPVRRKVRSAIQWFGLGDAQPGIPRHSLHSLREFDAMLVAAGAQKIRGLTVGFGPFTFLNVPLFSDSIGIRIHRALQALANRGIIGLRSAGAGYIVLAQKVRKPSRPAD